VIIVDARCKHEKLLGQFKQLPFATITGAWFKFSKMNPDCEHDSRKCVCTLGRKTHRFHFITIKINCVGKTELKVAKLKVAKTALNVAKLNVAKTALNVAKTALKVAKTALKVAKLKVAKTALNVAKTALNVSKKH